MLRTAWPIPPCQDADAPLRSGVDCIDDVYNLPPLHGPPQLNRLDPGVLLLALNREGIPAVGQRMSQGIEGDDDSEWVGIMTCTRSGYTLV
jgi:hypothetical protein